MKTFDLSSLVRENVRDLKPYSSARDEFQGTASVYLDANENPNNTGYNRYPDPHQIELKKKIAAMREVEPGQIFLGNGSDEPIDLIIRAFCKPGRDNVIIPEPTYGMYSISAAINDIEIRKVKLTDSFDLDVAAVTAMSDDNSKVIFVCSPNNPTGNLLDSKKIIMLLSSFHGIVVVDEAYIDFADTPGFLRLLNLYPNLVVLQTFSKAWGLAGIRLGMCFASAEIIRILDRIKPPYNISILTQSVALEKLDNESQTDKWITEILKQRDTLIGALGKIPVIEKIYPTDANFFLAKVSDAKGIYQKLVAKGIIVRDRSSVILCDNCLRITVGTESENNTLIEAFNQI